MNLGLSPQPPQAPSSAPEGSVDGPLLSSRQPLQPGTPPTPTNRPPNPAADPPFLIDPRAALGYSLPLEVGVLVDSADRGPLARAPAQAERGGRK